MIYDLPHNSSCAHLTVLKITRAYIAQTLTLLIPISKICLLDYIKQCLTKFSIRFYVMWLTQLFF